MNLPAQPGRAGVQNNPVDVFSNIEQLFYLIDNLLVAGKVVIVSAFPVHAMDNRRSLVVGFKSEGIVSISMRLHLLGIESLNSLDFVFHFLNYFNAKLAVVRQEVEEAHGAGFAKVQNLRRAGSFCWKKNCRKKRRQPEYTLFHIDAKYSNNTAKSLPVWI